MKRILLFALIIIVLPVMSRAQVFIAQFDAVNESDTLLCGVFGEADYGALQALVDEYNGIISKQEQSRVRQENREMAPKYTSFEAAAQAAELDRQRKEAIRQLEKALSGEQLEAMKAEINKQFDQMIADLPGAYSDMSEALAEQDAMLGEYDPSEYSDELKYDVKRRIAELAVDGRLYNYNDARDFRHGRAAVGKKTYGEYGTPQWSWGFVDESARVVIPIIYRDVYDFNNREYRQDDVFETLEDTDSQGWTTVRLANDLMGMVDVTAMSRYLSDSPAPSNISAYVSMKLRGENSPRSSIPILSYTALSTDKVTIPSHLPMSSPSSGTPTFSASATAPLTAPSSPSTPTGSRWSNFFLLNEDFYVFRQGVRKRLRNFVSESLEYINNFK